MAAIRFDVVPGLAPVLVEELGVLGVVVDEHADDHLVVDMDRARATTVRTAYAAYARLAFDVPRPKALLGDEHLPAITSLVRDVAATQPFTGVRIGAAGADSPVMRRLGDEVARAARLPLDPKDGDLLVRIVPSHPGWQVLVRLTPRPLSNRPWHVAGFEAALDASVAAAMVRLTNPRRDDVFLDPTCGSGTIVFERRAAGPCATAVGSDVARNARGELRADATALPFADASVTAVCANPPWGHQMGSHDENDRLYPALLAEVGRVARRDARFVLLTNDVRRFDLVLRDQARWHLDQRLRVSLRGHHPRVYVLTDSGR